MHELLGEFARYTPQVLIRLIADGATATLWLMPNVVGLLAYVFGVGFIIDKMTSLVITHLISKRVSPKLTDPQTRIGTPQLRILGYLPIIAHKLAEVWIGLPVLYVLSLIFDTGNGAGDELRKLVSGYSWQASVITQLPLRTWLNLSHGSFLQLAISIIAAFLYLNNVYVYYTNGFLLAKQLRKISDLLMPAAAGTDDPNPTAHSVVDRLRAQAWDEDAIKSALWFLFFNNMRIVAKNVAYAQVTPRKYGLFRTGCSLGIMLALKAMHPLVAAMKVYFEKKEMGKVRESFALYRKHLARLPQHIQSELKQVDPLTKNTG